MHVNLVTYDGDGNGATTMQTKIQLWNRTGNGWPDVVFTEQANDPVWMAQPPFDFALNLKRVFPASLLKGWPAPSLAQCTVNGRLVCLQDNLAQEVLYVNKKLMNQFGYTGPDDVAAVGGARREGRQGASRLHHRQHGRLVQPLALPVARPLPDLAGRRAEDRSHQLGERPVHPHGAACSIR